MNLSYVLMRYKKTRAITSLMLLSDGGYLVGFSTDSGCGVIIQKGFPEWESGEVELRDYIRIALRSWFLILSMALVGIGAGAGYSLLVTPKYESGTQLYVSVRSGAESAGDLVQGATFAQQIINSYVDVVETGAVLDPVVEQLQLNMTGTKLAEYIEASSPAESVLINITATSPAPDQAALIAAAVGESFKEVVRTQLEAEGVAGATLVNLTTTQAAEVPVSPKSPNLTSNLALGLFVGLVLGYGIAVLRSILDNRIYSLRDVQQITEKPLLGEIADDPKAAKQPLIFANEWQTPRAESFRALRTNLQFLNIDSSNRAFVVTSPRPGEGKTTTALNLALALSQTDARVALVECDLRSPKVSEYLGFEAGAGLTDVLIGRAELDDVFQRWGRTGLRILSAGRIPPNPSELLGSEEMKNTLETLQEQFDYVIIDAPPVLAVTDAAVVGKLAAGFLLVAAAGSTTRQALGATLRTLDTAGTDVLGVIVTMLPAKGLERYGHAGPKHGYSVGAGDYPASKGGYVATAKPVTTGDRQPALVQEN